MIASLALSPFFLTVFSDTSEYVRLLLMAASGTLVAVLVSLATRPEPSAALQTFFKRARPLGFWGPVAKACGEEPGASAKRLGEALVAVALSSLSIFCLLTAIGSWIVDSPPPTWFPYKTHWIVLLLFLGTALIPVWWRLGKLGVDSSDEGKA